MKKRQTDEEAIFNAALEHESSSERLIYLQEACGRDRDLFERIQALLLAADVQDDFLDDDESDLDAISMATPLEEDAGTVIGRYRLLE